jgi:hypothetical protein
MLFGNFLYNFCTFERCVEDTLHGVLCCARLRGPPTFLGFSVLGTTAICVIS